MKAKKTSPKSIRFNIADFNKAMLKGRFESAQNLVDCLLKNYINSEGEDKEISKGDLLKLMRNSNL